MVDDLQSALNEQEDVEQRSVEVLAELKVLSDEKDDMHKKVGSVVGPFLVQV